jgi:hypothetical protein
MSKLLFNLVSDNLLAESSITFLNKSIWYHANSIKNLNSQTLNHEISEIIDISKENLISDTPMSWYALDTIKYLRVNNLKSGSDDIELIKNILNQTIKNQNILKVKYHNLSKIDSLLPNLTIPINLVNILNVDYDSWKTLESIDDYNDWNNYFVSAVNIVNDIDPTSIKTINRFIKYLFVLKSQGEAHGSMSPQNITGSIFLPQTKDETLIAECLVHEGLHNYLYRLEHFQPFFIDNKGVDEKYYSPWKDYPRPLIMVLHGAFVFTGVIRFYDYLIDSNILDKYGVTFEDRLISRYKQVSIAINVLQANNYLSDFGKSILEIMKDSLENLEQKYLSNQSEKFDHNYIEEHFEKYSSKDFLFKT